MAPKNYIIANYVSHPLFPDIRRAQAMGIGYDSIDWIEQPLRLL